MASSWDADYNEGTLTAQQNEQIERVRQAERIAIWERDHGYINIPHLTRDVLRVNFNSFSGTEEANAPEEEGYPAWRWRANRQMWICHDCGCFGYKYGLKELFKCYSYGCRSRNVTVCRSGELSMLLRGITSTAGVNMQDIYNQRKERLRARRLSGSQNE